MRGRSPILARVAALSALERVGVVLLAAALLTAAGTGLGFAAGLTVDASQITATSGAAAVPVTTCTLTAAADTYADQNVPGSNFGTLTTFNVASRSTRAKRGFVRFDLTTCAIPAVASVQTADLRLFTSTVPVVSRTYDVHRATSAWVETTLTWTAQPTAAATATASTPTGTTANVTLQWNVLTDAAAFVAGSATNNGWRVKDVTETGGTTRESIFSAREHATAIERPTLVITYYP